MLNEKNSREYILAAVRENMPESVYDSDHRIWPHDYADPVAVFRETLESVGGEVWETAEIDQALKEHFPEARTICSNLEKVTVATVNPDRIAAGKELETVDVAVLKGTIGVAENGSVWLREKDMGHRVAPFICQHLVLVLDKKNIVSGMGHAYEKLKELDFPFGTFISGPSKTADIEQSLVIGAHGPKSLAVCMI